MLKFKAILLLTLILIVSCVEEEPTETGFTEEEYPDEVTVELISDTDGYSYVCRPAGEGPFPTVLYSHGGLGTAIGGNLEGTCIALAEAGYLARAEKRAAVTRGCQYRQNRNNGILPWGIIDTSSWNCKK